MPASRVIRRVLRIARRTALVLAAVLVVVIGLALILVHTDWGRAKIKRRIVDAMQETFPGGVTVGALEGSVVSDAVLRDVVINDRAGHPVIKIARLDLNLGLGGLLDDTIRVEHATADGVEVFAHEEPDGTLNLATFVYLDDEPFTWNVIVEKIAIRRGTVELARGGQVDHVDGFEVDARLDYLLDGTLGGALDLRGTWREAGTPVKLKTNEIRLGVDGVVAATDLTAVLDGFTLTGTELRYAGTADASGNLALAVKPDAMQRFFPEQSPHPAINLGFTIAPDPARGALDVTVAGTAGEATIDGRLAVIPTGEVTIGGHLRATGADVHAFADAWVPTALDAVISFGIVLDTALPGGERGPAGVISVGGKGRIGHLEVDRIAAHATLTGDRVDLRGSADGAGATADVTGALRLEPEGAIRIEHARVVAKMRDAHRVVPGLGVRGAVVADVRVSGTLSDAPPVLAFTGTVNGTGIAYDGMRAAGVEVALDQFRLDLAHPNRPTGAATVTVTGGTVDGQAVPTTTLALRSRPGGSYDLTIDSSGTLAGPGSPPWAIELAGVLHPGADDRSVALDLERYALKTRGVPWAGAGGRITISPQKIVVEKVAGQVDGGHFGVDGTFWLDRDRIDATIVARDVHLAQVDRALELGARGIGPLAGDVDLALELHRRGREVTGTAKGSVRGLAVRPGADPIDATIDLAIAKDRIAGTLGAKGRASGELALTIDVEPPADVTDPGAWAKLERRAIRTVTVRADRVDVVGIALALGIPPPLEGTFAGDLSLGPEGSVGQVRARDLVVPGVPGIVDADVQLDLADFGVVAVKANVTLRELARGSIDATVRLPARPFDLAAWRALDITALRGATVAVDEINVDDLLARRLGLGSWRGRIGGSVDVAEAMSELHGRIAVRGVTGSVIRRPIDVVVDATLDAKGLRAKLDATIDGVAVATGTASAPVDPDRIALEGVAAAMKDVPLTGAVTLLESDVSALLQTFGEARRIQGKVTGTGTLAGTLAAPEAKATVTVRGLGGRNNRIDELVADGSYAGGKLAAKLTASQQGGGTLLARASYDPAAPDASELVLQAKKFQISPLVRLLPDVVGVRGVIDADFGIVGLDPQTARPRGVIKIHDAQIPLIDEIGAITGGKIDLLFATGGAKLLMTGKSEGGDVELTASAVLDGLLPRTMTVDATVRNLTIISTMQPRIAAGLHAEVTLAGDHWKVDARLRDGRIVVPDEEGTALHPASAPADVVFVERGTIRTPPRAKAKHWFQQRPTAPFVRIALAIEPVEIMSKELRGEVGGHLEIAAGDDGVSIDGQIEARTGEVMVFDRRYILDRALLVFDGPPDPLLDIRMQHEFPSVSMYVGIRGRLSDPELDLSSSPSVFTEGQLLGFLLGGRPGSATGDSKETLQGAAASVASQTVGGFLTRRLPVKVDVLRYEPATTSTSAAVAVGKWVSDKLLILARSRIDARADENRAEAELEYWWTDRTLLDLSGGDRKVFGADILWTKRW